MTQIVGTITDSVGGVLSGVLTVTLSKTSVSDTTTPDTIYTTRAATFAIASGVLDIQVPESETYQLSYLFSFLATGDTEPLFEFYKVVPNVGSVEFSSFFPTGISSADLDTSLLRIARLMGRSPSLSQLIKQPAILNILVEGETTEVKRFVGKPFPGAVLVESLTILGLSGYENWDFDVGILNSSGNEEILIPGSTATSTNNGRRRIYQSYEENRAASIMGFFIVASPQGGASAFTGTLSLAFTETES